MKNKGVLIFCPDMDGHRQNYCFVIARIFAENGYHVILASSPLPGTNSLDEAHLVNEMIVRWSVDVVDIGDMDGLGLEAGSLVNIVRDLERFWCPEWTFFPTGDQVRKSLSGLGEVLSSSDVKRAAIFIGLDHIYRKPQKKGKSLLRIIYEDFYAYYRQRAKWNIYYNYELLNSMGLNVVFVTNPDFLRFAKHHRITYLPEIYRAWGAKEIPEKYNIDDLCHDFKKFIQGHEAKNVILYFGGWSARRGYDQLLNLSANEQDSIFVSCGRPVPGDAEFTHDVESLRRELYEQGRIFEIDMPFLADNYFYDLLFNSCNFVLLPYNDFMGLSGVMILATSYGKPVLVPSIGFLGSVVRRKGIGLCYRNGDYNDFRNKYRALSGLYGNYVDNSYRFSKEYSYENVRRCLIEGLFAAFS